MGHGITEVDRGVVWGTTWHELPQYRTKDGPVTLEEAIEAIGYNVEKRPVFLSDGQKVPDTFALVRTDLNRIVYPAVGNNYIVVQNEEFLRFVDSGLANNDGGEAVQLESVGSLFGGQTCFANYKLPEINIPKDPSKNVSRLMYTNSFGGSPYRVCAHSTRIVCNNTLRFASAQGAANNTLQQFRHVKSGVQDMKKYIVQLLDLYAFIDKEVEVLVKMSEMNINDAEVKAALNALIPIPRLEDLNKSKASVTIATKKQDRIIELFDTKDDLQGDIRHTRYSLLQATLDYVDHDTVIRNGDDMSRYWDGLYGGRDLFKQEALAVLHPDKVLV